MEADVTVIGSGPAGLTAALHAEKSGAKNVLLLEREEELGGILKQCIHNGFGLEQFKKDYTGPEYAERLIGETEKTNVRCFLNTMVTGVAPDRTITAVNPEKGVFQIESKSVVLAMGCRERARGSINIPGTRPAGVYTAGVAQRFVNIDGYLPGKEVVILGSGDIGLIMARRLTLEGAQVKGVYEIMDYPGGLKRNIVQCLNDFNIPLYLSRTVTEIRGKERVEGVVVSRVDDTMQPIGGSEEFISCDTLLLSVGLIPENELSIGAGVELSPTTKGPITTETMETSVPGIFCCGNVSTVFDLVDYVAQTGISAGGNAARFSAGAPEKDKRTVEVIPGENVRMLFPQRYCFEDNLILFIRSAEPFERAVRIDISPLGLRIKRPYARPNEMIRVKVPKEKLKDVTGPIEVNIRES
ncbi:MAG: NAD(P)/FAD-dependent oxidoreductase [Dehalococcoidia bacterium]|nr:MAG: NAD(P)/FAD-dependent oxidoreductase [Dehalococcoidia bacterium]